jgi:hypothetical protein
MHAVARAAVPWLRMVDRDDRRSELRGGHKTAWLLSRLPEGSVHNRRVMCRSRMAHCLDVLYGAVQEP